MQITDEVKLRFRAIKLRKALRRIHRDCPIHHLPTVVCTRCIKTYCIECNDEGCPRCLVPASIPPIPPFTQEPAEGTALPTPPQIVPKPTKPRKKGPTILVPVELQPIIELITQNGYELQSPPVKVPEGGWDVILFAPEHTMPKFTFDDRWNGWGCTAISDMPKGHGWIADLRIERKGPK